MSWTAETIESIPKVYRDFMLYLKRIPDTSNDVLKIKGLTLGQIYSHLSMKFSYAPEHYRAMADELKSAGLVEEDDYGFFRPTDKGVNLIEALADARDRAVTTVPHLPADLF